MNWHYVAAAFFPPIANWVIAGLTFSEYHVLRHRNLCNNQSPFRWRVETFIPTVPLFIIAFFVLVGAGTAVILGIGDADTQVEAAFYFVMLIVVMTVVASLVIVLLLRLGKPDSVTFGGLTWWSKVKQFCSALVSTRTLQFLVLTGIVNILCGAVVAGTIYFMLYYSRYI